MANVWDRLREHGPLDDAEMLDLEERDGRYHFTIRGGDDFGDAVTAVKQAFLAFTERNYDPETHVWSVAANEESERKLGLIFPNAANAFRALHAQMRMFD